MTSSADGVENAVRYHKRDLWIRENTQFAVPHYRLEKVARIINRLAAGERASLLDIGCGPATLSGLLAPTIEYYGIDIAVQRPAPNLLEADLLERPIDFDGRKFDVVLAQGFFEYVGEFQSQKLAEIACLLKPDGKFIVSYTNYAHRACDVYWLHNNIQPISEFRRDLSRHFCVRNSFPTSHNWRHGEPNRKLVKAANMHLNRNIPVLSPLLAVEYFFICTGSRAGQRTGTRA